MSKLYISKGVGRRIIVHPAGHKLNPRTDLMKISEKGFEWGHECQGARQLALAILADAFDDLTALTFYVDFATEVIELNTSNYFSMVETHVRDWLRKKVNAHD